MNSSLVYSVEMNLLNVSCYCNIALTVNQICRVLPHLLSLVIPYTIGNNVRSNHSCQMMTPTEDDFIV